MKKRLAGGLLLLWVTWAQANDMGKPVPSYRVPLVDGSEISSSSQQHRITLLHFWASWCVPCREEMPRLESLYQRFHDRGLDIVAIDMDNPDDLPQARAMMSHYHFPWALANQAEVGGFGRIWRLPLSILIDRHGIIRQNAWAADDDHGLSDAELERQVIPLIDVKTSGPAKLPEQAPIPLPPAVLPASARASE